MTDLRKAAEMALEALETIKSSCREGRTAHAENEAAIVECLLRQALAQPESVQEQEPVPGQGKQMHDQLITAIHRLLNAKDEPSSWGQIGPDAFDIAWHQVTALVSHICTAIDSPDTPPKREWVGLTDEEFMAIAKKYSLSTRVGLEYFKDELEATLKEKST